MSSGRRSLIGFAPLPPPVVSLIVTESPPDGRDVALLGTKRRNGREGGFDELTSSAYPTKGGEGPVGKKREVRERVKKRAFVSVRVPPHDASFQEVPPHDASFQDLATDHGRTTLTTPT